MYLKSREVARRLGINYWSEGVPTDSWVAHFMAQ